MGSAVAWAGMGKLQYIEIVRTVCGSSKEFCGSDELLSAVLIVKYFVH
jgi:hypothetical protein